MLDYIKLACYNGFKLDKQAKNDKQKVSSSKVVFCRGNPSQQTGRGFLWDTVVTLVLDFNNLKNKGYGKHKMQAYSIITD